MYKFLAFAAMALPTLAIPVEPMTPIAAVEKRQYFFPDVAANCPYSRITGGPKGSAFEHWQVTDNISCGGATCSAAKLKEHTFGISAEGTLAGNIAGLGIGVTNEWTSGEQYTCQEEDSETVCVWVKMAYTIYDLATADGCQNHATIEGKIPNANNAGGGYYCVVGADLCRSIDSHYWE